MSRTQKRVAALVQKGIDELCGKCGKAQVNALVRRGGKDYRVCYACLHGLPRGGLDKRAKT